MSSNTIITPTIIAKEALMQLQNNLVMGNLVYKEYKNEFVKVGASVSVRKPVKFQAVNGPTLVKQDVSEGNTSITVNQRKHVGWEFSTQDLTLSIGDYSTRYIQPACIALAQQIDSALAGLYASVWNSVGTPGTVPSAYAHLAAASQKLDEGAVPVDNRNGVFNPQAAWSLANGLSTSYVQKRADNALDDGSLGHYAGMNTYKSQSVASQTVGNAVGTPLVNGAGQSVTYSGAVLTNYSQNLVTNGWTANTATLNAGDVITIAGVYSVNPVTKATTGALQSFVVNSAVTADGSGNMTVNISPPIITSGAYQTVSAAPASNAAITVRGAANTTYPQNLVFHKNAFALVTVPLEMPDGAAFKARESFNGLSIRVIKDYDIVNDTDVIRLDTLYGVKAIYPELACRLTS